MFGRIINICEYVYIMLHVTEFNALRGVYILSASSAS